MTKLEKLKVYLSHLESRLGTLPDKHKEHPETFKQFIKNEIESTKSAIEKLKVG